MRFRKKPVEIEARQLTRDATRAEVRELAEWCGGEAFDHKIYDEDPQRYSIRIPTLEGTMTASSGDWIIKGVQGEFYPCKSDIFAETYDPITEGES